MQVQKIITLLVGLGFGALATWKGPTVAGEVGGAISAVCLLFGTLHVLPSGAQEYIDDLESALEQNAPEVAKKVVKS